MDLIDKIEDLKKDIVECEILLRSFEKKSKPLTLNLDTSIMMFRGSKDANKLSKE